MSSTPLAKLFIGSSAESIDVAEALQSNLHFSCDVTVWSQLLFPPSQTTLAPLIKQAQSSDFAIFVFRGDDLTLLRDSVVSTVRDNVILELGLFIGQIGLERTYFLIPEKESLHIASDLLGLTPLTYKPDHPSGLMAGLGPAVYTVKRMVKELGLRAR
ncbi:nucleotide-binding protein [Paenibacillus sp. GCM10023248]|uniref:nucleotide-binding protein n=1 Tax=Bacillales TaxID=1385 RepID=UPI002379DD81|nr:MULTISPECIES: nucleotide-binding protein [Bacillales]MDD9268714.1 nucleotide-binding protein [Paenibacillus sp. MAHUQ-63]MDR6880053.1 putative nucleotide-binding protein [Bacillus sp. 3255]